MSVPGLAYASTGELVLPPRDVRLSTADLWSVLALEAVLWIELGVANESLPKNVLGLVIERDEFWRSAVELADEFAEPLTLHGGHASDLERYALDFFESAAVSREALTPEHLEFLRLIHFSSDDEWQTRLSEVGLLRANGQRSIGEGLRSDVVDRLSWALSGLPEDAFTLLPADWRWWWIGESNHTNLRQRSGSRWADLKSILDDLVFLLEPLRVDTASDRTTRLREQAGWTQVWREP